MPYKITNEVVEFDEPSLIAWRHMGGHIWRYRLRPVDGGTEVTEEFDLRPAKGALVLKATGRAEAQRQGDRGHPRPPRRPLPARPT